MKHLGVITSLLLLASGLFAQSDRGTITGTIADPAGAVVANAPIEAKNAENGALYEAASTATGNYTIGQLPAGTYEVSVTVPGFKKYVRAGLAVQVAQIIRIDIALEVGSASESVTITEAAPLLKTESGEVSHNVTSERIDSLPVMGIGSSGASSSGIRNPLVITQLLPGTLYIGSSTSTVRVNGAPTNSQAMLVEGLDATNGLGQGAGAQTQASVDAIQEFAIQTSNYAAEFGQAGGGVFNMTMKSGTNQFHGTVYDYFVNEALNAGVPFTNSGNGQLLRPVARRNDYGGTFGGPVRIPKVYNGHDRTFFFFNYEQFRETQHVNNNAVTVPIAAFRTGNFSQALTGRTLGTDPLGRPVLENAVFDPTTQRTVNGQLVRDQFPNNTIPASRLDPVALKVQSLFPQPTGSTLVNNGIYPFNTDRNTYIPSLKIDHQISTTIKLAFYGSYTDTAARYSNTTGGAEGLPQPISAATGTFIDSHIARLSYDQTLSPTLLLHLGAGYQDNFLKSPAETTNFNPTSQLGLTGPITPYAFPQFTGLTSTQGGMNNIGTAGGSTSIMQKTTAVATLTWVKDNHTYKAGSTLRVEGYPQWNTLRTDGTFAFSGAETGQPYLNNTTLGGGNVGFPYASFLLGLVDSGNVSVPTDTRLGKSQWGFYGQDSWKVSRKLTLDYGLRYDYSQAEREQFGRLPDFSATTPNPSAGGQLGAIIYEGAGPGHCNCIYTKNYPWAFGPRLGGAYQITPKTVLRAGFGIMYDGTDNNNRTTSSVGSSNPFSSPAFGQPAMTLSQGIPLTSQQIAWPNFSSGYYPLPGTLTPPPFVIDPNGGRPARQYMWSVGLQREIARNLVVEASFVGNRGIWWNAPTQVSYNALTPQRLQQFGININNPADVALLNQPLNSATVIARGFKAPYVGFPTTATLAQSLRPFPQFASTPPVGATAPVGLVPLWAPLGDTWYDSLQVKATKRFSHGIDFTYTFSWQKTLTIGAESDSPAGNTGVVNDVFNRQNNKVISAYDQPMVSALAANYTVPKWGTNKYVSYLLSDWQLGAFLNYASGLPILAPVSTNNLSNTLFQSTYFNRVPGVPLFTHDLNCHCFDPNTNFVLNPAAWTNPAAGQFGTSAPYYTDYRQQRRPQENLGFGRQFRITEKVSLNIRAEFTNIFNRTEMNAPTSTNALAAQTVKGTQPTAGFGWINTTSVAAQPRQGTIIARFRF